MGFKNIIMFDKLNKRLLFTTIAALLVVVTGMYTILAFAEANWNIGLNTISGNEAVLKGIIIKGVVQDYNKFALEFEFSGQKLKTALSKNEMAMRKYIFINNSRAWNKLTTGTSEYEMNFVGGAGTIAISRRLFSKNYNTIDYARLELPTGYFGKAAEISQEQREAKDRIDFAAGRTNVLPSPTSITKNETNSSSTHEDSSNNISINVNNYTPTMQVINDKLYFIIPKVKNTSGSSGLYVVESFDKFKQKEGCRKLIDIPLNGNDSEMISLGKVEDRLCLIRYSKSGLAFQYYNLNKQAFEPESIDKNVDITDSTTNSSEIYEIYSNSNYINVVLRTSKGFDIYTYSFKDGIRRENKLPDYKKGSNNNASTEQIFYIIDLLYILEKQVIWHNPDENSMNSYSYSSEKFYLSVYDRECRLVYKGELDAGQNDDNIRYKNSNEQLNTSDMKGFYARRITGLQLKGSD